MLKPQPYRFPTNSAYQINPYLWIAAMLLLFALIYTPIDLLLPRLPIFLTPIFASQGLNTPAEISQDALIPLKELLFLVTLIILGQPIYQACCDFWLTQVIPWRKIAWQAWLTFMATALLAWPQHLTSLGWIYGRMSLSPFAEPYGWYYKRLFMPALAHIFMFRGLLLYFIFTLLLTYLLIYLSILWLQLHEIKLSLWQLISLSSSTFIIYQFQAPGYPDVLLFNLMLLMAIIPLSEWGQLSIITFCFSTHEGSIIPLIMLILFACKRPIFWRTLAIYAVYFTFWFSNQNFNLTNALASQDVDNTPTWQWLLTYPSHEILGILFAYKALWLIIIVAIGLLLWQKNYLMAGQISSLIMASIFMTFLAVDTTRLVGFSFFALLLAIKVCYDQARLNLTPALSYIGEGVKSPPLPPYGGNFGGIKGGRHGWQRFFLIIWAINLLLPSIDVGLNHPFAIPTGLYYWLWVGLRPQ